MVDVASVIVIGNQLHMRGPLYLKALAGGKLEVGDTCFFNHNCSITCMQAIKIGSNCKFGNNLVIVDHDHNYKHLGDDEEYIADPIQIGNNVWIPDDHNVKPGYYDKKKMESNIFPVLINDGVPLSRGVRICRWAKLIKKELLIRNLFWTDNQITIGEDLNIMFPVIMEASSIDILPKQYLYHYRANDASIMKRVSPDMFSKVELLYKKELEIATYYREIYDFTHQIEMDFCDLSINIFVKEYIQNNSFENFMKAKSSRNYKVLKQNMHPLRYKKSDRILAAAFKTNSVFSFILIHMLELRNRSNR